MRYLRVRIIGAIAIAMALAVNAQCRMAGIAASSHVPHGPMRPVITHRFCWIVLVELVKSTLKLAAVLAPLRGTVIDRSLGLIFGHRCCGSARVVC